MNRGPRVTRPEDTVVANVSKKKLRVLLRLGRYMFQFRWGYLLALCLSVPVAVSAFASQLFGIRLFAD